ncbi:hypothetical protein BDV12DRAFT_201528 [Aspergillus spectabilis]
MTLYSQLPSREPTEMLQAHLWSISTDPLVTNDEQVSSDAGDVLAPQYGGSGTTERDNVGLAETGSLASATVIPSTMCGEIERSRYITADAKPPAENRSVEQSDFGRIGLLSPFLPQIDPENPRAQGWSWYFTRQHRSLALQLTLTVIIFLLNLSVTIWAILKQGIAGGTGLLYQGNCTKVEAMGSGLHLVVNVLSTAILGASNYCMQILVAPTRNEVDRAHASKHSLDIGIPSFWNLLRISRRLSGHDLQSKRNWTPISREWNGERKVFKFRLASTTSWIVTIGLSAIVVSLVSALLHQSFRNLEIAGVQTNLSSLWDIGFGHPSAINTADIFGLYPTRSPLHFWGAVFYANCWQLMISIVYVSYNSLLTQICVGLEWSHLGKTRKFLRTSCPNGMQRSSYFLSLPFRYGIPLSVTLALLHWFASQSIFLAQPAAFYPGGERVLDGDSSRVCFSSIAIIFGLGTGLFMVLMLLIISSTRVTFRLPVVLWSSAAISAACHRPDQDNDAAALPVTWGVVPPQASSNIPGTGHCSLTTYSMVQAPVKGNRYM